MVLNRLALASSLLSLALTLPTLTATPAMAQAPIASGTLLVELTADPASHLVVEKDELESRLCGALSTKVLDPSRRVTKDPDQTLINYDDQVDTPADPPDPPPGAGGFDWQPDVDGALLPSLIDSAPRVVYHLPNDITFDARGQAVARPAPLQLCGRAIAPVNLSCGSWDVSLRLHERQAASTLSLFSDASGDGGTFTLETEHTLYLTFHNPKAGRTVGWATERQYSGFGSWQRMPGEKEVEKAGAFRVDTDCDGYPETWVDGTTDLHLGWTSDARLQHSCLADSTTGGRLCFGPQVMK